MHWVVERILVGRSDRQTIAKYARGADKYLGVWLLVSAALLGLAITQPMVTTSGFLGLDGSFSLLSGMLALLSGGQGGLALLIAVITVALPILLLSSAFEIWYKYELSDEKFSRKTRLLFLLGRVWLLVLGLVLITIYLVSQAEKDTSLHFANYYLVISLALQKLVVARLKPMVSAVEFVVDEEC